MKQFTITIITLLLLAAASSAAQRVELRADSDDINVTVLESSNLRTVIRLDIGAFTKEGIVVDGKEYFQIRCAGEGLLHVSGEPSLPHIARSIIIPDEAKMQVNVLSSEFTDLPSTPVISSKGKLYRNVNPDDILYTFDSIYESNRWYPSELVELREPYILRDFRGCVVDVFPFAYNPVSQTLRVYTSITVEIVPVGTGETNIFNRTESFDKVSPDFELIYRNRFINYNYGVLLYNPVLEDGDLLIITYDAFHADMMPLVEWKMQKGIKTTIVDVSTIGNNSALIGSYIQSFYDTTDLAWVLLVGDGSQIASPYASGGASDPSYAKVAGSDNYPDIFVGRFSAENSSHVQTQVQRTTDYEKFPEGAYWYHRGTGVASNQGPGHFGEYDHEHLNLIRIDLLAYNYTLVDQIYDPSASSSQVTTALNSGRSIVNYTGHGTNTTWSTTGFSNSHVNALTNENELPFIISVACVNGNFTNLTCFAEAWLRATNNGNPTGALAAYMSSINQSWDPPMYAQDEAVDLLVAESKTTFGGICFNGSCHMIDVEGADGVEMYDTWHIFGDPSVQLFTDTPVAMTVNHDNSVIFTVTEVVVEVVGIENALCALYHNGVLYGSAYSNSSGFATITLTEQLPIGENITLTVTALNRIPYISSIMTISPSGPYVIFDEYTINDSAGNSNSQVDFGESILLGMQLINVGPDSATEITAILSSTDPLVSLTDTTELFGNIPGNNGTVNIPNAYAFDVSAGILDGHVLNFSLTATDTLTRETWTSSFFITAHAPDVGFVSLSIDDATGNGNGILEAGETASVIVTLANDGSLEANSVIGTISESDPYITIDDSSGSFGNIAPSGGHGNNQDDVFVVTADSSYPQGQSTTFDLAISADGGYSSSSQFIVKTAESFEYSNGGYTGAGEWQWGSPTFGPPGAYFGVNVWGTNLTANYGSYCNDALIAPAVTIHSPGAQLEYYQWFDFENNYDGGNVSVSSNGGVSWNLITPTNGYPGSNISALSEPGFTGTSGGWQHTSFSLANFVGQSVLIRWRFASDGLTNKPGWYIDDVAVTSNIPQPPPDLSVSPGSFLVNADSGNIETRDLVLFNDGEGPLYFQLYTEVNQDMFSNDIKSLFDITGSEFTFNQTRQPIGYHEASGKPDSRPEPYFPSLNRNSGGPDDFGYYWVDSNEPGGPVYSWVDITSTGTSITGLGDDTNVGPFPIGFNFDFYDNTFNTFRFSTNGFISFTSTYSSYSNRPIPTNGNEPLNLIAPFWDDLNFNLGGNAYYYSNNADSLIISWVNVPHYGSTGPYTLQIILLASGKIIFQYQDVNSPFNSSTTGIQNSDGSIGLQVNYNSSYATDNLAVEIFTENIWLTAEPASGIVPAHDSLVATVTFDATELSGGIYTGSIIADSNDPINPELTIPATFEVGTPGIADILLSPASISDTLNQGEQAIHHVIISNNGTGTLDVNFSVGAGWLILDDSIFQVAPSSVDTLIVTISAIGLGIGAYLASIDFVSNDPDTPSGSLPISLVVEEAYICEYVPGDINGNGEVHGSDITYGVQFFRGSGSCPPDSCYSDSLGYWLYTAGDANGNCEFLGSDITYLVNYFRGVNPSPQYCPLLPPSNPESTGIDNKRIPAKTKGNTTVIIKSKQKTTEINR